MDEYTNNALSVLLLIIPSFVKLPTFEFDLFRETASFSFSVVDTSVPSEEFKATLLPMS